MTKPKVIYLVEIYIFVVDNFLFKIIYLRKIMFNFFVIFEFFKKDLGWRNDLNQCSTSKNYLSYF